MTRKRGPGGGGLDPGDAGHGPASPGGGRVPWSLRLAARLLPVETRDEVLGDLIESWRTRIVNRPRWRRAIWLARQPLAALRACRAEGRAPDDPRRIDIDGRGGGFSWLDVKLGIRMLGRQPLLTVVAGLTFAFGIPSALAPTHILSTIEASFPVEEGERIFGIRNWNMETSRPQVRPIHDLAIWKETLTSFETIAAARSDPWNVHSPDGQAAEVRGAEVTPSVFEMLRVPPLLGRPILDGDVVEGAEAVVVVGEDLWESRFGRDPDIVGQVIRIGRVPHTIVGVMPSGFRFPNDDDLWLPLHTDPDAYAVGSGPDMLVFGRLADGVSLEEARAEVETVGGRLAVEWSGTHEMLRSEVVSIPTLWFGEPARGWEDGPRFLLLQLFGFVLLAVACGNVGILILARTATRISEISVRTALGASRARILSQLFIESLVLSVGATAVGLLFVQAVGLRVAERFLDNTVPYWVDIGLGPGSIGLALGLAALCAVLAGVVPAIRATSPNVHANLQRHSGGASLKFGPFTTVLVVAEVALSMGFLCLATAAVVSFANPPSGATAVDYDRYLVASYRTPWVDPTEEDEADYLGQFRVQTAENHVALRDRLQADPAVQRVAMASSVPGLAYTNRTVLLTGDENTGRHARNMVVMGRVHFDYFRDLGMDPLQGRLFTSADVETEPGAHRPTAIVNDQFVDLIFGGGDVVGRQFRYMEQQYGETGEWFEIVGVVETFGSNVIHPDKAAAAYHPIGSAELHPMRYLIEVADGDAVGFIPKLRRIAADVDPEAMVQYPRSAQEIVDSILLENRIFTIVTVVLSGIGVVLAVTGLYALMSFTVSQRTREIGIRAALGAGAYRIVAAIARRAGQQLIMGVALGSVLGWFLLGEVVLGADFDVPSSSVVIAGVSIGVIVFATLACLSPALRGLRIQPTEALKAE